MYKKESRTLALPEEILLKIDKPGRYIGGEYNSVNKGPDFKGTRYAMAFPDVYEIEIPDGTY